MSEENKIIMQQNELELQEYNKYVAYNQIPYSLISEELKETFTDVLDEFHQILRYYKIYKLGMDFVPDGAKDYVPSNVKYKLSTAIINKESRFLFAESPDIKIKSNLGVEEITEEEKKNISNIDNMVKKILAENNFEDALLKGSKDCFIGKRVACFVNFNEEDGVQVIFVPSLNFIYDTKINNPNELSKIVCFVVQKDSKILSNKRIFKKKYILEDDGFVYVEEALYDGAGKLLEELTSYQPTKLKKIPAVVFVNDGLTGNDSGESEIESLKQYDSVYSKLSNGDIDAERKNMNPVTFTIDMNPATTKGLSRSAGSFWDLSRDILNDNASPQIGVLESTMSYSTSLDTTLKRVKNAAYELTDIPNINLETMVGSITSGKALKAIYWPLIVRCKEKMKMWGPNLKKLISIIVDGAIAYPNCVEKYIESPLVPVLYDVEIEQNIPIQEDAMEEKQLDLSEVESKVMSRKSYMKKWRDLTDKEIEEELNQIALERQIIEDAAFMPNSNSEFNEFGSGEETSISEEGLEESEEEEIEDNQNNQQEVINLGLI